MRVSFTVERPHTGTAAAPEASLYQNLHLAEFQTNPDMHIPGSGPRKIV